MQIAFLGHIKNLFKNISQFLVSQKIEKVLFVDASCLYKQGQATQWSVVEATFNEDFSQIQLNRVFTSEVYYGGTVNIGEYLAIMQAIQLYPDTRILIFSDSKIARNWFKDGRPNSFQKETEQNADLMRLFKDAAYLNWRYSHRYTNDIFVAHFYSRFHGTNPADFSRK